ncbi:tape measure protein [Enterobacter sp.]|uniref:tape measure protein n=1 Tax=Enterobacter sp. TaxID=42895 RepID=UPI002980D900|nr:tape measure protein [Enterobacter sp.]
MENVGGIYYEIKADTHALLQADKQVEEVTNNMERGFERADDAADGLNTGLSKLASALKALIAVSALREMARMVQSYQEMAERVQMATSSQDEFERVQKRLLNTANGTYRSLAEAQELYIRSADGLRSMGYSTEQAIDVQDSMSYAFVKNAASAERADSAISAFTKAINTGTVSADQWESITTAIPTVINDIAAASGKSAAAVRAFGASGKLTASDLTEGLKQSLEANTAAAAGMSNNLVDASVRMRTAVTAMLVAVEGQTGVIQSFTNNIITAADTILSFAENSEAMTGYIDSATLAAKAFALVMAGRYAGSLKDALSGKLQSIAATRQLTAAENQSAQSLLIAANAAQRKTLADKEAAFSAVALAQAELNVARGSNAEMTALENLSAAKSRARAASLALVEAETAQAAASARAATAARAASVGFGLARGALSLIGGPAGVAMIAASALLYWWQTAQQARQEAIAFADGLDKLNASMKSMSNKQLRGAISDANSAIEGQQDVISDLTEEIDELNAKRNEYIEKGKQFGTTAEQGNGLLQRAAKLTDQINQKERDRAEIQDKLIRTSQARNDMESTLSNNMLTSMGIHDRLIEKGSTLEQVQGAVARAFGKTADEINRANQAGQNFNPKSLQITPPTADGDKIILNLEEQNDLLKIQDERQRAIAKARMAAAKVTDNPNQIASAERLAAENYDLQEAEEARRKAQQQSEQQGKNAANQMEANAQKIADYKQRAETATGATQDLSREQALLRAEQSLNKSATAGQIEEIRKYAAAEWDAANAIKQRQIILNAIPELKENAGYDVQKKALEGLKGQKNANGQLLLSQEQYSRASEQLEQDHQIALAKIRAGQAVTPQQSAAGEVDPVQQLANQHAQQLALIQQFEQQGVLAHQQAIELKNAADTEYEHQRIAAQWEIFRNQSQANELLASSLDGLQSGASNAITGLLNGTQSLQESFANIGSTILNSVVSSLVQMGIEWVKSQLMGQAAAAASLASTTAQATAAASAWAPAAISASIATMGSANAVGQTAYAGSLLAAKGMAVAGARRYGGNVSAGNAYRINENGESEIFQTAGGQQVFIPDKSGKVIPADKAGGGGGVIVQQTNHYHFEGSPNSPETVKQFEKMAYSAALRAISNEQRPNGLLRKGK